MKILAIDTSGQQASAAIVNDFIIIGEILLNARWENKFTQNANSQAAVNTASLTNEKSWTHSEILMPGIDELFRLTGISKHDIDYLAYTCGPGSFTGLRIGAATALGLAAGLNKTAIAVPTLCSLAYNLLNTGRNGLVVPIMDARRGQVYSAVFTQDECGALTRVTDYMALPVEEMILQINKVTQNANSHEEKNFVPQKNVPQKNESIFLLGDGACAYKETIKKFLPHAIFVPQNNNCQRASSAALWALEQIKKGYTANKNVDIIYVRAPQAIQDLKNKAAKNL